MIAPGQLDGSRLIYDGVRHGLGGCPFTADSLFCCLCYEAASGEWFHFCMPDTPEYIIECEHLMGGAQCGIKLPYPDAICPDVSCNPLGLQTMTPPGGFRLGVRVEFSGLRTELLDSSAELLGNVNSSLRCPLVSSQSAQAVFIGSDAVVGGAADEAAAIEVHVTRHQRQNLWFLQAYALVVLGGVRYRLLYFLAGGINWPEILAGATVRVANGATTAGARAGILAHPAGWAEISVDRLA